ncbi:hypothetical protein V8E52_004817 [Russula decolorans]
MLPEPNSSSITVPGIAETQPPAAEPPMPAADINLLVQIRLGLNHRDTFSLPNFSGLTAFLGYGAAYELLRRSTTSADSTDSPSSLMMMAEANLTRVVFKHPGYTSAAAGARPRLPPRASSAHNMSNWPMEVYAMASSFGPSSFTNVNPIPFATAPIGKAHHAVLEQPFLPTGRPERVAVKIQFPNTAESVASDPSYFRKLLMAGRLLPRGLFLDKTLAVMKEKLTDECNYTREAASWRGSAATHASKFRGCGSTDRVLVMEHMDGTSVGEDAMNRLSQEDRKRGSFPAAVSIAARVIDLCLHELFVFRDLKTDSNWSNSLWNPKKSNIFAITVAIATAGRHHGN